jgi:signal transduction histidine kinase
MLQGHDRLLEATAKATSALLTLGNFDEAINIALEILVEGAGCDRINVLEGSFDDSSWERAPTVPNYHTVIYEWARPGLIQQMAHLEAGRIASAGIEAFLEQHYLHGDGFGGLLEAWHEPLRSAYAAVQVQSSYSVPIRVKEQWWGVLCLNYCRAAIQLSPAEVSVLRAIADCIGTAILRDRTQKITRQAEQERAAELEKANHVLKQTVDLLTTEPDIDRFLGHVLKALAEQIDAPLIQYWEYPEPGDIAYLRLAFRNGQILTAADLPNDCLVTGVPILPQLIGCESLQTRKRHYVIEDIPTDPMQQAIFSPLNFDLETWCTEQGIRKLINIPLMQAEKTTSALLLYFPGGHPVSEPQIELMYALARQVTLAIQLTQLADKAKQGAILNERNRMARDIHDTLAQSFTGIIMQTEALKTAPRLDPDEMLTALDRIGDLARLGLSEARRSVQALRPIALETANFPEALRQLLQQITDGTTMQTHLNVEGATQLLPAMIEENLLRIAQEAITNTIRHSHAQTITLQLLFEPTAVHLQIIDDGQGFVPDASLTAGFGLIGMQERAHHLEGQFHLVSQPGQGTEITVTVPIGE